MSLKYQEKIDKYVDDLFYSLNSNSSSIQPFNQKSSLKIKKPQLSSQQPSNVAFYHEQQKNNGLTKEDIQFFQLLYPYQQPKQIMKNLLKLYKEQKTMKNSFQQIQAQKNQHFIQMPINQNKTDRIIQEDQQINKSKNKKQKQNDQNDQNVQYKHLIQACYVSLGEKLVQTHISKPQVQISNVNFYTRQYVMPHIKQVLNQRTAKQKQKELAKIQSRQKLIKTKQKLIHSSFNNHADQSKVFYIPANQKGHAFDLNEQIQEQLFDYIDHNDYNRVLRDINQTIQRNLLKYRQNKYTKHNPLFTNWNSFLLFIVVLNLVLYLLRMFFIKSQNFEIICFLTTALTFIIILAYSLNNYKTQCISEQIKTYLNFYNCKSRNVKWILGKYFFWIEIHVKGNKTINKN